MSYLVTRPFEVIKGSALYIPDHVQQTGDLIAHDGVGFVDDFFLLVRGGRWSS
jgi:hypothetical protein